MSLRGGFSEVNFITWPPDRTDELFMDSLKDAGITIPDSDNINDWPDKDFVMDQFGYTQKDIDRYVEIQNKNKEIQEQLKTQEKQNPELLKREEEEKKQKKGTKNKKSKNVNISKKGTATDTFTVATVDIAEEAHHGGIDPKTAGERQRKSLRLFKPTTKNENEEREGGELSVKGEKKRFIPKTPVLSKRSKGTITFKGYGGAAAPASFGGAATAAAAAGGGGKKDGDPYSFLMPVLPHSDDAPTKVKGPAYQTTTTNALDQPSRSKKITGTGMTPMLHERDYFEDRPGRPDPVPSTRPPLVITHLGIVTHGKDGIEFKSDSRMTYAEVLKLYEASIQAPSPDTAFQAGSKVLDGKTIRTVGELLEKLSEDERQKFSTTSRTDEFKKDGGRTLILTPRHIVVGNECGSHTDAEYVCSIIPSKDPLYRQCVTRVTDLSSAMTDFKNEVQRNFGIPARLSEAWKDIIASRADRLCADLEKIREVIREYETGLVLIHKSAFEPYEQKKLEKYALERSKLMHDDERCNSTMDRDGGGGEKEKDCYIHMDREDRTEYLKRIAMTLDSEMKRLYNEGARQEQEVLGKNASIFEMSQRQVQEMVQQLSQKWLQAVKEEQTYIAHKLREVNRKIAAIQRTGTELEKLIPYHHYLADSLLVYDQKTKDGVPNMPLLKEMLSRVLAGSGLSPEQEEDLRISKYAVDYWKSVEGRPEQPESGFAAFWRRLFGRTVDQVDVIALHDWADNYPRFRATGLSPALPTVRYTAPLPGPVNALISTKKKQEVRDKAQALALGFDDDGNEGGGGGYYPEAEALVVESGGAGYAQEEYDNQQQEQQQQQQRYEEEQAYEQQDQETLEREQQQQQQDVLDPCSSEWIRLALEGASFDQILSVWRGLSKASVDDYLPLDGLKDWLNCAAKRGKTALREITKYMISVIQFLAGRGIGKKAKKSSSDPPKYYKKTIVPFLVYILENANNESSIVEFIKAHDGDSFAKSLAHVISATSSIDKYEFKNVKQEDEIILRLGNIQEGFMNQEAFLARTHFGSILRFNGLLSDNYNRDIFDGKVKPMNDVLRSMYENEIDSWCNNSSSYEEVAQKIFFALKVYVTRQKFEYRPLIAQGSSGGSVVHIEYASLIKNYLLKNIINWQDPPPRTSELKELYDHVMLVILGGKSQKCDAWWDQNLSRDLEKFMSDEVRSIPSSLSPEKLKKIKDEMFAAKVDESIIPSILLPAYYVSKREGENILYRDVYGEYPRPDGSSSRGSSDNQRYYLEDEDSEQPISRVPLTLRLAKNLYLAKHLFDFDPSSLPKTLHFPEHKSGPALKTSSFEGYDAADIRYAKSYPRNSRLVARYYPGEETDDDGPKRPKRKQRSAEWAKDAQDLGLDENDIDALISIDQKIYDPPEFLYERPAPQPLENYASSAYTTPQPPLTPPQSLSGGGNDGEKKIRGGADDDDDLKDELKAWKKYRNDLETYSRSLEADQRKVDSIANRIKTLSSADTTKKKAIDEIIKTRESTLRTAHIQAKELKKKAEEYIKRLERFIFEQQQRAMMMAASARQFTGARGSGPSQMMGYPGGNPTMMMTPPQGGGGAFLNNNNSMMFGYNDSGGKGQQLRITERDKLKFVSDNVEMYGGAIDPDPSNAKYIIMPEFKPDFSKDKITFEDIRSEVDENRKLDEMTRQTTTIWYYVGINNDQNYLKLTKLEEFIENYKIFEEIYQTVSPILENFKQKEPEAESEFKPHVEKLLKYLNSFMKSLQLFKKTQAYRARQVSSKGTQAINFVWEGAKQIAGYTPDKTNPINVSYKLGKDLLEDLLNKLKNKASKNENESDLYDRLGETLYNIMEK